MSPVDLRFVVAFDVEAQPLIDHYALRREPDTAPYAVYTDADRTIWLIVSGPGATAAAAATAYLHALTERLAACAWLNIGIAGARVLAVGTPMLAHKIVDTTTGRAFYPPLTFKAPCQSTEALTVPKPTDEYPDQGMVEMEAAGFYATASRFSTGELVQCLKVISDNADEPIGTSIERLRAKVPSLLTDNIAVIDSVVDGLRELAQQERRRIALPKFYAEMLDRWHFTVTEQHQLRRVLQRWQVLMPEVEPMACVHQTASRGRDVMWVLEEILKQSPCNVEAM